MSMSYLNTFDYIAAVSPDLRQAIDQGAADPHRWRIIDGKLIDSKSNQPWYEEEKSDEEIENEAIEKWLNKIECRQLIAEQTVLGVMNKYKEKWQSHVLSKGQAVLVQIFFNGYLKWRYDPNEAARPQNGDERSMI